MGEQLTPSVSRPGSFSLFACTHLNRETVTWFFFLSVLILNPICCSYIFIPLSCPNTGPSTIDIIRSLWSFSQKTKKPFFKSEQRTFYFEWWSSKTPMIIYCLQRLGSGLGLGFFFSSCMYKYVCPQVLHKAQLDKTNYALGPGFCK